MSTEIRKGKDVNNGNSFLSIPFIRPQETMISKLLGIIIYIGVHGAFPLI